MILFNLSYADLSQISNNFFKFLQSRTVQFSSLPRKVDRTKEPFRKYVENIETERSFFLDYVDDYLHVADQLSMLSCQTWEKGLQKLTTEEQKEIFFQKIARPFPKDFLAEIDVAFKKSYNILCAFQVLNVDNLKQQSNLVDLFETSIWVLGNFYGTEQVDEFQGKESKVDAIIDKEQVMKDRSIRLSDLSMSQQKKKKPGCC